MKAVPASQVVLLFLSFQSPRAGLAFHWALVDLHHLLNQASQEDQGFLVSQGVQESLEVLFHHSILFVQADHLILFDPAHLKTW